MTAEQGLLPTLTPDAVVETEKGVATTAPPPPHIDAPVSATIVAPHADGDSAPAVAVCGLPSTCTSSDSVRCIDVNPPSLETPGNVAVLNDVGNFIGQKISDFQKRELLVNHWQPPADYNFPFSTYNCKGKEYRRNLNQNHLDTYKNWLVLSHTARGLYCEYCSLFNVGGGGLRKTVPLKNLVTEPLLNFKHLLGSEKNSVLEAHEHHHYHKQAVEKGKNFLASYDKPEADVLNQVHQQRLKEILENRERLVPIVRATLFLGRQGASFRGHRDDGQLFSESGDSSASVTKNEGNFRELLRLMVASGDTTLEEHLKNAKSNATYISKTSQNELIDSIGEEITQQILTRLHKSLFYSILFDETTDLAHKSQLSAIIRYVAENTVYEDFVGFIDAFADLDCAKEDGDITFDSDEEEWDEERRAAREKSREEELRLTGIAIGQIVVRLLTKKLGLRLDKCVGIGTDTCSVMMSEICGAVKEIQKEAKNALRTPCFNHKLNLSISQSNKIPCIRNAVGTMKECVRFFDASAKRSRTLQKHLGHQLSGLCETRWVERHDGVLQFSVDLPKILAGLESLGTWHDSSTSSKAAQLRAALTDSSFLVSVMCLSDILALTLPLSKLFQKKSLNLDTASETVTNLMGVLSKRREDAEQHFNAIWFNTVDLAENVNAHLVPPRRCGRQGNRANYVTDSPETYFRLAVYIPLTDQVLTDLRERFPAAVLDCFDLPLLLPNNITGIAAADLEQKADLLANKFDSLLPTDVELSKKLLLGELTMWKEKWRAQSLLDFPECSAAVLKNCDSDIYPTIHTLLSILTTLPVSNASAERSFSALRRLKSWLRTTMSQDRLTGLALMHVHRDLELSIDSIITRFAKSHARRIDFLL